MSAGGSTGGSTDFVWIKLATAKEDVFAKVAITSSDLVTDVAERSCAKFPRWRLDAGQVRLHPVTVSGKEPSEEEIGAAWATGTKPLAVSEGVTSGAWLVAAPTTPGSSGGGGGGGAFSVEELLPEAEQLSQLTPQSFLDSSRGKPSHCQCRCSQPCTEL